MRHFILLSLLLLGFASALCGVSHAQSSGDPSIWPKVRSPYADEAVEARVADIIARMSLEEKVGQLILAEIQSIGPGDIKKYHIGAVLNGGGSYPGLDRNADVLNWLALAEAFYEASIEGDEEAGRPAIPILWGTDAVHGNNNVLGATIFPHNIGLGAANNPGLMRDIGIATAREVITTGVSWTFAPTVAVARDSRWGRTYESYSEDPAIVAELGKELILGLQGHPALGDAFGPDKVIATSKHFVGDGGTLGGDDQGDTQLDERTLYRLHGRPHAVAVGAGVQTVMASFSSWNGSKAHGDKYLLSMVLKERMGFDGFVLGDWNGHAQIPGCTEGSCPQAINAGVDLIMVPTQWLNFLKDTLRQVRRGVISEERLDDAVARILRVKIRAGLLDRGKPSEQLLAGRDQVLGNPAHRAVARQAVRESLVLLKNEGVLPIKPGGTILVTGPGADSIPRQSGGWSVTWQGNDISNKDFPGATSIYAGIKAAAEAAGGGALLADNGKADAAIVVFGETPYAEFEGDNPNGAPFDAGGALGQIRKLKADGIPVVAVYLGGRPRIMTEVMESADAFVAAWLPGTEGGGVADVLLAKADGTPNHDFKGKLSFSWPKTPDQYPVNKGMDSYDPLFPLGYGLTYAQ